MAEGRRGAGNSVDGADSCPQAWFISTCTHVYYYFSSTSDSASLPLCCPASKYKQTVLPVCEVSPAPSLSLRGGGRSVSCLISHANEATVNFTATYY